MMMCLASSAWLSSSASQIFRGNLLSISSLWSCSSKRAAKGFRALLEAKHVSSMAANETLRLKKDAATRAFQKGSVQAAVSLFQVTP